MDTIIKGVLLGLSIAAPIGPTNIEIIRRGLREGWRALSIFFMGVLVALIFYLLMIVFGLSFLTNSKTFNQILLTFGVLVLSYLSYCSLRDFFVKEKFVFSEKISKGGHFISGIILTISNPVVLLFWTGIMGANLASTSTSWRDGFYLSIGILLGATFFTAFIIFLVQLGKKFVKRKYLRYISLLAGIVLLYFTLSFGYKLVMTLN